MILLATETDGSSERKYRHQLFALVEHLKQLINSWVAAIIAHRERQVAMVTLSYLSDRELKDMGLCRGHIYETLKQSAHAQSSLSR